MKSLFNKLAQKSIASGMLCLILAGSLPWVGCTGAAPEEETESDIVEQYWALPRPLTPGEARLAHDIFGDAIDLSGVQILLYAARHPKLASNVLDGEKKRIAIYGERFASDDYTQEKDPFLYGILIHELTRIWQHQTNRQWTKGQNQDYLYNLHKDLTFPDYGSLQQSAIMEDYLLRFFHPDHQSRYMIQTFGRDNCEADSFLIDLVEKQFPAAKTARQKLSDSYARPLTPQESALARSIFGNQIDTAIVRNRMEPRVCINYKNAPVSRTLASVNSSRDINYWGKANHSFDYTQEKNPDNFGTYIHELTHIWQMQTSFNKTNWKFENKPDKYAYPIDVNKWKFTDYSIEQQGAMIEDYVRYFLHPAKRTNRLAQTSKNLAGLKILVENQFPGVQKTREYFEKTGKLPLPAPPAVS